MGYGFPRDDLWPGLVIARNCSAAQAGWDTWSIAGRTGVRQCSSSYGMGQCDASTNRTGEPSDSRMNRLAGRVCLVTGSTGIAAATAERFAAEGASVFVTSRDEDHCRELADRIGAAGGRAAFRAADLTDDRPGRRRRRGLRRRASGGSTACSRSPAAAAGASATARSMTHRRGLGRDARRSTCGRRRWPAARSSAQMLAQEPNGSGTRGSILLMGSVTATDPVAGVLRHPRLCRGQGRDRRRS